MDITEQVLKDNSGRRPEMLLRKWVKMKANAFTFLRGTAPLGQRILHEALPQKLWSQSPTAWLCGDAHPENAGTYRGWDRQVYFDINDFDESVRASVLWDIGRAGTALSFIDAALVEPFLAAYREALLGGKALAYTPATKAASSITLQLLEQVSERKRADFLEEHTRDGKLLIVPDHTFALSKEEKALALSLFKSWAATQPEPQIYKVYDVTGRLAGNGSLGVPRYVFLVKGRKQPHIIDAKLAAGPALRDLAGGQPAWSCEAERVATAQRQLQYMPILDLGWHRLPTGESYLMKELQPLADRITLERLLKRDQRAFVGDWAKLLAGCHIRGSGWKGASTLDSLQTWAAEFQPRSLLGAVKASKQQTVEAWRSFCKHPPA